MYLEDLGNILAEIRNISTRLRSPLADLGNILENFRNTIDYLSELLSNLRGRRGHNLDMGGQIDEETQK